MSLHTCAEPGQLNSILTRLQTRYLENLSSIPGEVSWFFLCHCIQIGTGVYAATFLLHTRGSFPEDKVGVVWHCPVLSSSSESEETVALYLHSKANIHSGLQR
jgi:hypothetical protein